MAINIGAFSILNNDTYQHLFKNIIRVGLKTCQLQCWDVDFYNTDFDAKVACVRQQIAEDGIEISALWAGYTGKVRWNFTEGPITLGLVPTEHRWHRIEELKRAADFAAAIGAPAIITHCGFLPENMTDAAFLPVRMALLEIASYCKSLGIGFWFETGQETPVVLLRYIKSLENDERENSLPNLGINLDSANLLMYGKGNPIDALNVFGSYVKQLHVKDGCVPTDGLALGLEKKVGEGQVDFPNYVKKLLEIGFDGAWVIEREIPEGTEQDQDILDTINNLRRWAGEI